MIMKTPATDGTVGYVPAPADLSDIRLPDDISDLTEKLAKQVHETWAQNRIRDGWKYGRERSDELRTTPCLVPYEDLPEEEKAYDRETASATLKTIIHLGYSIIPGK